MSRVFIYIIFFVILALYYVKVYNTDMSIPFKKLLRYKGNIYELVSAVVKRTQQITDIRSAFVPTTLEDKDATHLQKKHQYETEEKAASIAFKEIFDEEVIYKVKKE